MQRTDHYLTTLKKTTIPDHHLALDTEARIESEAGAYRHRFACAVTAVVVSMDGEFEVGSKSLPHESSGELWRSIDARAHSFGSLTVWAHNLAYDLRVSRALSHLVALGWRLDGISLHKTSTWCAWRKGPAKLTIVDSFSWLPAPLERIAADLNIPLARAPLARLSDAELQERCRADCAMLAQAVVAMLNFIRSEDLGPFRPTGSGQSHAAFRRRFLPARTLRVHTDTVALAAEREAMHTGRTEAWRHGPINGPLWEFDMSLAYCRIAAVEKLPVSIVGVLARPRLDCFDQVGKGLKLLMRVRLRTSVPVVPVALDDRVIWPVGEFTTWLWDAEAKLALDLASDFHVEQVYAYRAGDALQPMARWLIERLEDDSGATSPVIKRMLKHWARTLVGRMGLRYRSWEPFGRHPRSDLCISTECEGPDSERYENMRIGHEMFQLSALTESYSSIPSIPGYVASRCRVHLWTLVEVAGPSHVYYMDTDGLLVDSVGAQRLERMPDLPSGVVLRKRGPHRNVTIHGPRNVELGEERRLSGIPRKAIQTGELEFEGETWSGLQSALETGRSDFVEVASRHWQVTPVDNRREHLEDGATAPFRLEGSNGAVST